MINPRALQVNLNLQSISPIKIIHLACLTLHMHGMSWFRAYIYTQTNTHMYFNLSIGIAHS
uniref:Uncharacterized protein n=1 Tax=Anguilla anguilla TaxID=7936 RepID=A0A0E9S8R6_ANGAN